MGGGVHEVGDFQRAERLAHSPPLGAGLARVDLHQPLQLCSNKRPFFTGGVGHVTQRSTLAGGSDLHQPLQLCHTKGSSRVTFFVVLRARHPASVHGFLAKAVPRGWPRTCRLASAPPAVFHQRFHQISSERFTKVSPKAHRQKIW